MNAKKIRNSLLITAAIIVALSIWGILGNTLVHAIGPVGVGILAAVAIFIAVWRTL